MVTRKLTELNGFLQIFIALVHLFFQGGLCVFPKKQKTKTKNKNKKEEKFSLTRISDKMIFWFFERFFAFLFQKKRTEKKSSPRNRNCSQKKNINRFLQLKK